MRRRVLLLLLPAVLCASEGYWLLQMMPDARSVALAEAGVAYTGAGAVSYHNPALLASGPRIGTAWIHTPWVYGLTYDHYAASLRPLANLTAGLHVSCFDLGRSRQTDEHGNLIGYFHPCEYFVGATGAYRVHDKADVGLTGKVIYSNFSAPGYRCDALGAAADIGAVLRPTSWLSLAVACENLGTKMKYRRESVGTALPVVLRGGFEARPRLPGRFELAVVGGMWREITAPHAYTTSESSFVDWWEGIEKGLGLELWYARTACVRMGYFENVGNDRGGLRLRDYWGYETYRVSVLRFLTQKDLGKVESVSLSWGAGLRFRGVGVDVGIADAISWTGRHYKFQLSYEM